jgi:ABC-type transport system substrate-binding protein
MRLYKLPGPLFDPVPQDRLEDVLAPDDQTIIFHWTALYPEAGSLRSGMFEPLPRHLLQQSADQESTEALSSLTFWSKDFVGAGPYRLQSWTPGQEMDALAFDGHALGRPKIDRVIVKFVPDENTMLTNLLAENVHMATDNSLRFEHALVLKQEWTSGKGTVLIDPIQQRITRFQLRPEYLKAPLLLDLRVRRAIAYANDRQAIVDGLFSGEVPPSDQALPRSVPYFAQMDQEVTKYPFDLRRTEELLREAGLQKGPEGAYLLPSGERFAFESWVLAGSQNEKQGSIMANTWRRAGFDVKEYVIPVEQSQDGEARSVFPGVSSVASPNGEYNQLRSNLPSQIPTPANRWRGNNYGGWVSPDYERLWNAYNAILARADRDRQVIDMMKVATDQVVGLYNFHNPTVTGFLSVLQGPALGTPDSLTAWNIHEWVLR